MGKPADAPNVTFEPWKDFSTPIIEWEVHEIIFRRLHHHGSTVEKPSRHKNEAVLVTGKFSDARNKAVSATENVSRGSTALSVSDLRKIAFLGQVDGYF